MKRVALITGGTRGIGLGIARSLAGEGFDLMLAGRKPLSEIAQVLDEVRALGASVAYCVTEVGFAADRTALLEATREVYGALHVLVNNAGMAPRVRAPMIDASESSFEEVLRVNLQGPYFLTQAAARWMIAQREADASFRGCIININSISAVAASIQRGEYCVSKAGLAMATRLWAVALAPYDIPVYELRPGLVKTDMTAGVTARYDALIAQGLLLQPRWGTPDDVGRAAAMLVRGDLPYTTGEALTLDGGLLLPRL
jgi:NAD(P)-dependent dehydrogenase (short-subunit alcohol dehydrogenase family)